MKLTQLRNATVVVEVGESVILVDPMLARAGRLPPLRWLARHRRANPLVELPDSADALLDRVTHCLVTHCRKGHFDHLDRAAVRWLRERNTPVICMPDDAAYLGRRGLNVKPLNVETVNHEKIADFLDGTIRPVPCRHGHGWVGRLMAHGHGYCIELAGEPRVYLAGDTVLTDEVRQFLTRHQPDVSVIPAGGARFDVGRPIIMGACDAIEVARLTRGVVVANHLEALDHCPVGRDELRVAARLYGVAERLRVPQDGETLVFAWGSADLADDDVAPRTQPAVAFA
ncbi:MBL fold metallo-hydrolase [Crenobacter cavernae]|uniref:MBL fold metallo-hydrolase n=1 Tax=Crenobacter cavernae TaxID=2290923 RepID=A0A345Y4I6_9NEIS|nr:MBL fold metallo-hydrolase [Crenobacter cavernae]AXK38838.1 MBL fold metallo-hydrolase [Crenobacter cavernae]